MASRRVIENNELKAQIKALEERNKKLEKDKKFPPASWGDNTMKAQIQINALKERNKKLENDKKFLICKEMESELICEFMDFIDTQIDKLRYDGRNDNEVKILVLKKESLESRITLSQSRLRGIPK